MPVFHLLTHLLSNLLSIQTWAKETGRTFTIEDGRCDDRPIKYPVVVDAKGEPILEETTPFLLWYAEHTELSKEQGLEKAKSWLLYIANLHRTIIDENLPRLEKGIFASPQVIASATKLSKKAVGEASISSGAEQKKRADNVPTPAQIDTLMRAAYSASKSIHPDPLRALQTGIEFAVARASGVRGEVVRGSRYEHCWLREHPTLASGEGIQSTVTYHTRGDKTHATGDGTHSGFMPNSNILLCPSSGIGLCDLYRFTARREAFPSVLADNDGANPGYQYKWRSVFINTDSTYKMDAKKGLLELRGVSDGTGASDPKKISSFLARCLWDEANVLV